MAVGNSNGDIHMLKYAMGHQGLTLGLLVHHDDPEREYAYDDGAEKALQLAPQAGCTAPPERRAALTALAERLDQEIKQIET
ncbi:MAG: nonspecific acid phosphatase precursor [Chloroflexi bacterium]|nr:nonspecific acid phosphatase precursor [Chloroflexota bacterium]